MYVNSCTTILPYSFKEEVKKLITRRNVHVFFSFCGEHIILCFMGRGQPVIFKMSFLKNHKICTNLVENKSNEQHSN